MNPLFQFVRAWIAAGVLCVFPLFSAYAAPIEIDRIVAVVNNEVITAVQLRERVEQIKRQLGRQGVALPPDDILTRQILERLISERAQIQLARDTGIRVDDAAIQRAIGHIAESNHLTLDELRRKLADDGISWQRFREQIEMEMLVARLREREVENKVVVTDAEVDNFLASNPDAFSGVEYNLAHILLRAPEGATPEQIERLRARAEAALSRLHQGEDFARVAAEVSDAPDGLSGGELGWRPRDRLPGLYADVVLTLKPGEVSAPLRSAAGIHIVKLLDKRGGNDVEAAHLEQTRVRHILIRPSEVLSDTEAKSRLLNLRERILNGTDFAELAKAHSADLSAAKGGDIGWVNPGDTVPEFERAMNELQPGAISQPVQSPFGWHLIQVMSRRVQDVTDERKRSAARNILRERKSDEAYDNWLRQLRDSSYVQYKLEEE